MASTTSTLTAVTSAAPGIRVIKGSEGTGRSAQTAGKLRRELVTQPGLWIGMSTAPPGAASAWHHHGDHDTYIYMLDGRGRMEFGADGREACDAEAGDLILISKGVIHREVNPGAAASAALIVRVGTGDVVVDVAGPPA